MQPRVRAAGATPEGALWLCCSLGGQNIRRDARGLSVKEEQWNEQCVDDIAVEAEALLVFVGAGMAMGRAEAT